VTLSSTLCSFLGIAVFMYTIIHYIKSVANPCLNSANCHAKYQLHCMIALALLLHIISFECNFRAFKYSLKEPYSTMPFWLSYLKKKVVTNKDQNSELKLPILVTLVNYYKISLLQVFYKLGWEYYSTDGCQL